MTIMRLNIKKRRFTNFEQKRQTRRKKQRLLFIEKRKVKKKNNNKSRIVLFSLNGRQCYYSNFFNILPSIAQFKFFYCPFFLCKKEKNFTMKKYVALLHCCKKKNINFMFSLVSYRLSMRLFQCTIHFSSTLKIDKTLIRL